LQAKLTAKSTLALRVGQFNSVAW